MTTTTLIHRRTSKQVISVTLALLTVLPTWASPMPPEMADPPAPSERVGHRASRAAGRQTGKRSRPSGFAAQVSGVLPGASRTLLPDGRTLVAGGLSPSGPSQAAVLLNRQVVPLGASLGHARAWHTATVLPNGTVLIFGGVDQQGVVSASETYDPRTERFEKVDSGIAARAYHTATLLTDGRVLFAGGIDASGVLTDRMELWDTRTGGVTVAPVGLGITRRGHSAELEPDGSVRISGGLSGAGTKPEHDEIFQPETLASVPAPEAALGGGEPALVELRIAASLPTDGAVNVPTEGIIAVRFSRPVNLETVNASTVTLSSPQGPVAAKVVGAERGTLLFLTPQQPLREATSYTVLLSGVQDTQRYPLAPSLLHFATEGTPVTVVTTSSSSPDLSRETVAPKTDIRARKMTPRAPVVPTAPDQACGGYFVADPSAAPPNGPNGVGRRDPVDAGSGLFVYTKVDLFINDVLPIQLTRTYRQGDSVSRAFGIGTAQSYGIYLVGDTKAWTYMDLVLPDGSRIHYGRISPGQNPDGAVYEHDTGPSAYFKSQIRQDQDGGGYDLYFKDGTYYVFAGFTEPTKDYRLAAVQRITDRYGNSITMPRGATLSGLGPSKIASPSGAFILLTYDAQKRITQASDNIGRTVSYSYDSAGRLASVVDVNGGTTRYTYDSSNQLLTITDARNITYITNQYDSNGRVLKQTMADGSYAQFTYLTDASGRIVETDITDNAGTTEKLTFDTGGYFTGGNLLTDTIGGQTASYQYQSSTNLATNYTDPLGRQTTFTYDANANVATTTLAGTGTTAFTYDPQYNQLSSVQDALGHTTLYNRDGSGNISQMVDAAGVQTNFTYNPAGQVISAADASGTTRFAYTSGILSSTVDGMGNSWQRTIDGAGRPVVITDPTGTQAALQWDAANNLVQVSDPLNGVTSLSYDPNGNLTGVQNPRGGTTTYTSDNMDRLNSRKDPLNRTESYTYDAVGNLKTVTDRKGQVRTYGYDALNRFTSVTYADATVTLTYDNGNRPTSLADTAGGTINWTYDNLGMLLSETSPQGSINYTNDNAGRRTGMTVTGGPSVTYSYDNAGRMTGIQQAGQAPITVAYDGAGRRSSMTLPNGMVAAYGYDGASRLTTLSYSNGATSIGSLAYLYDGADRPISISGSMAQTGLPVAASNGAYDAANQLTSWNGFPLSYDANGNLTNDGTNTYGWDARNRLTSITGATSATYQYDGLDRRALNPSGTRFLYDGAMAVTESQAGATVATYTAGPGVDEMLARTDSTGTQTFVVDGLGSTVALASNAGSMTTQYSYDAYGRTTASGGASANPFQYAGREADPSGLYYYRARYYSPALQRFISEDPLRFGGGDANFYSYASGNPAANTDPSGLGVVEQLKSSAQKVWAFRDRVVNFCQRKPEVVLITLGIIGEVIMEVGTVAEVAKTAPKLLNQFNDVDSLIQNAGKLARLKGGKLMGTVTGDGEAIFRAVSQGGETLSNGYVKMADGTIVGSHIASSTGEFTIDVNRAGQIFKIRVSQ